MFKERWRRGIWITGTIAPKVFLKKLKFGDIISVGDVSITVRHIIVNFFIEDIPD